MFTGVLWVVRTRCFSLVPERHNILYALQITNSAVHAQWAVVFAQLHINGKNEGIHGFLVRIRHEVGMPITGPPSVHPGHYHSSDAATGQHFGTAIGPAQRHDAWDCHACRTCLWFKACG